MNFQDTNVYKLFLLKKKINDEIDELDYEYFGKLAEAYGKPCPVCGWIQGRPNNGLSYWFCDHLTNKLERRQDKRKKEIMKKLCLSVILRPIE
jgi:hypothetical protein